MSTSEYKRLRAGLEKPAKPPFKRSRLTAPKLRERDVTKQVCDYLRLRGWFVHRNHVGVYQPISGGAPVRMGEKGAADMYVVRPRGGMWEFWYLELKAPGKRPNREQVAWMERQHELGFEAVYFDNLDKCVRWVETRFEGR